MAPIQSNDLLLRRYSSRRGSRIPHNRSSQSIACIGCIVRKAGERCIGTCFGYVQV